MVNQVVQKYYTRMAKEALLNAFICALGIGFGALLLSSFVFWMTDFNLPWIGFIIMFVVAAATMPLMYYKKFRPSKKAIAQRVDALGLKERLLTMVELEGDDSYIAQRQRADAQAAVEAISDKIVKIVVSVPAIVLASVFALTGGAMATVSILAAKGVLSSGKDIIEEVVTPAPALYEIEFIEVGEGMIEGDLFQLVEEGQTIGAVTAIPDDEWFVYQWLYEIDGVEYTLEETDVFFVEDLLVNQNMIITVVFAELSESEGGDESGEGGEGEEGDESEEMEPKESEGEEGESDSNNKEESGEQDGGDQAGGQIQENETIIDGKMDYGGETYDNALNDARGELEGNEEISDDLKDIIEDYFGNIEKN